MSVMRAFLEADETKDACASCGRTVYVNGEGVWFGPDGKLMCPSCAPSKITPDAERVWNSEKGCWESVGSEGP